MIGSLRLCVVFKFIHSISEPHFSDLDSQFALVRLLETTDVIFDWRRWLGLSACGWFSLEFTDSISDRIWLISNLSMCVISSWINSFDLELLLLVFTLSLWVVSSRIFSLHSDWCGWRGLSACAWLLSNLLTQFLTVHGWCGLSDCAWFALESIHSISEPLLLIRTLRLYVCLLKITDVIFNFAWLIWALRLCVVSPRIYSFELWPYMIDLDSGCACFLSNLTTRFWACMVNLDCQDVRSFLSKLLNWFLKPYCWFGFSACAWFALAFTHLLSDPTWLISTLSVCVVASQIYSLISDYVVDLDCQQVRGSSLNLLFWFLTLYGWFELRLCVVSSWIYALDF